MAKGFQEETQFLKESSKEMKMIFEKMYIMKFLKIFVKMYKRNVYKK